WRATGDPFYLNAARIIIERVLERRTPGSGWERQLVPGHCYCTPRCRGACSFMQGILGVGLREYYRETADPRVAEAVPDSARYVIEQMWNEEREMFRYTSCPQTGYTASQADTLGGLMLFAWELTDDPRFADIALRSMNLALDSMGSISHVRWTPYIVTMLDRIERERVPGLGGERGATVILRNPQAGDFQVHVLDRDGRPAPPSAAELTGPDGATARPGEDGRIVLTGAPEGIYRLRLDERSGPWQVTSSLNRLVASLRGGLELDVAAGTWPMTLHRGAGEHRLSAEVLEGRVSARLIAPSGKVVAHGWEAMGRVQPDEDGAYALELTGPGRVRISAQGWVPWAALHSGCWFNASAPSVLIEGRTSLAPGEGRTVQLTATVRDPEDDVVRVRWLLSDGRELEGATVQFEPPADVTEMEMRAIAEDATGNSGEATVRVRIPEPALADAQGIITVQAEDFSGQGGGEVLVTERIGNVGKMITQWHANVGHWLEWLVVVPADGDYLLFARYATQFDGVQRELTIDGASPGEAFRAIDFPSTGGFCTTSDDWATLRLGPAVHLSAGPHTIRMTNPGNGLALDWIALAPAEG
ncbi:MAG: carbohydrate-binding domain-containing protein, partial [Armatimonadota bacterium]